MSTIATTKLSSRGQVVIPEEVRKALGLSAGAQFVVVGSGDTVVLKLIHPPPRAELKPLLEKAQRAAEMAGVRQADIDTAIEEERDRR